MTDLEKRASRMKWDPPAPGTEERKKMPASAFLSPSTKTFPYKVLIDGQWVISEKGLRSAISVANFRGNPTISAKASKILDDLLGSEEVKQSGILETSDESLSHHGILGMRWGIRRDRGPDGLVKGPGKPTEDYLRMRELRSKGTQGLTNVELKAAVERMNLEKQYKDLVKKDVSAGRAVGNKVLSRIGDKVLDRVIDKSLNAAFDAVFKKK